VKNSLHDLEGQLKELARLAEEVARKHPPTVFSDETVRKIMEKLSENKQLVKEIQEQEAREAPSPISKSA